MYVCVLQETQYNLKPFALPNTWLNNKIDIIGSGSNEMCIISLDARQGYHQAALKKSDK